MEPGFTVLTLGVDNLEKSFKFYHDGLGWPSQGIIGKEYEHGEVAFFDLKHGMKLALYSRENLAWDSKTAKENSAATEFSIGYTVKSKEEVDSIMDLAKKAEQKFQNLHKKLLGWLFWIFSRPRWSLMGNCMESTIIA
ncbi:MAG: VOC family protein [Segetibacter sp.]